MEEKSALTEWISTSGLKILAILIVVWVVRKFSNVIIARLVRQSIKRDHFSTKMDEERREQTLISIITTSLRIALWVLGTMIVLTELGINIGPLLAGAGVAGLAIGFGAQSLIKDFVAGIFIIMENQYRVGDIVKLDDISGQVEAITMRATVLRDLNGRVHHISNGNITVATNMTMEFSKVNIDVGVAYDSNIDKVEKVTNDVGDKLAKDLDWHGDIIEAPQFTRITNFSDSSIDIKIIGKVNAGRQWAVAGEMRRRLKVAFDKEGIEIPFPQRVIHESKK
jgi:moderate conductance mechanosensitive channel